METARLQFAIALTALTDTRFHALIAASNGAPPVAYGLLVWIDAACDWELSRRAGHEYELQPPEAAIDPSEDKVSINAAIAMRASFALGRTSRARVLRCAGGTAHRRRPETVALESGRVQCAADDYPLNALLTIIPCLGRCNMDADTIRRLAVIIRWLSIGWIVIVYLVPPLLLGSIAEWDAFFDDAFLLGGLPGGLGLILSYTVEKSGRKADQSASEGSK